MIRNLIASLLLRLYPRRWRREYGAELRDLVCVRPFTIRVVVDLAWNGLRQRGRDAAPSTILGLVSLLVVLKGVVLAGGSYLQDWTAVIRPSSMTFPTITVTFLSSNLYALLLMLCGAWTRVHSNGTAHASGRAAMRMSLFAGAPVMLGALLLALGVIDIRFVDPAMAGTPNALAMLVAPLTRLPESWIWGALGGCLAGWAVTRQRRHAGR